MGREDAAFGRVCQDGGVAMIPLIGRRIEADNVGPTYTLIVLQPVVVDLDEEAIDVKGGGLTCASYERRARQPAEAVSIRHLKPPPSQLVLRQAEPPMPALHRPTSMPWLHARKAESSPLMPTRGLMCTMVSCLACGDVCECRCPWMHSAWRAVRGGAWCTVHVHGYGGYRPVPVELLGHVHQ